MFLIPAFRDIGFQKEYWIPGVMQLWGEKGVCSAESEFIMDVNKSFQIGKIGMREGGCNFITFGLNVRLKLCL